MRLYSYRIQNFRSIIDTGEIKISENDNITILAGQNESGKTSILEALQFFEQGADNSFDDDQRRLETSPQVNCTYHLTDNELKTIESELDKNVADHLRHKGATFRRGEVDSDKFDTLTYVYDPPLKDLCEAITYLNEDSEEEIKSINDVSVLLRKFRPQMLFYSSFDGSILPPKISASALGTSQAVEDFEKVFEVDFKTLLSESDKLRSHKLEDLNNRASDNLNEYWKQQIEENSRYRYKVEAFPQIAQPNDSYVTFCVDRGDNHPLSIGQKSTGFRWFASFNLRLRAHQASYSEPGAFILLIDEPGQGLHEQAQSNVMRVLNEMSGQGWQILYSTHLPQLLGGQDADLSRIKLVVPSLAEGTKVRNIAQATTDQGFMDALSPVRTALGQITLDVSTFLNGRKTVIVEGISDYYYFTAFALLYKKQDKYSFVPPVGVTQIPNVFAILLGWGVNPYAIVDGDGAGTREFNKLKKSYFEDSAEKAKARVYVNAACDGIEDIFDAVDFKIFADSILTQDELNASAKNSVKAKLRKELLGRTFFDRVKSGDIQLKDLSRNTKARTKAVFDFLERA